MPTAAPLLVITHADAGAADERSLDQAVEVLREAASVEVCVTSSPEDLDTALEGADGRRVVVAGGDGSLHAVIAALHRRGTLADTVLGLIPLGTGNDFARTLGVPLEPVQAATVVVNGEVRPVDLIVDDEGSITVNTVHLGAGADAGERGARWKSLLGMVGIGRFNLGRIGYPIGAVQTALDPPVLNVRVEVDGTVVAEPDQDVLMVAVGNGRSVGGGTELTPDADPHDGLVDVLVAAPSEGLARLGYALRLPFARQQGQPEVRIVRGRDVSVEGTAFCCNSDGEIGDPVARRSWTVERAAYLMVLPAGRESERTGRH